MYIFRKGSRKGIKSLMCREGAGHIRLVMTIYPTINKSYPTTTLCVLLGDNQVPSDNNNNLIHPSINCKQIVMKIPYQLLFFEL